MLTKEFLKSRIKQINQLLKAYRDFNKNPERVFLVEFSEAEAEELENGGYVSREYNLNPRFFNDSVMWWQIYARALGRRDDGTGDILRLYPGIVYSVASESALVIDWTLDSEMPVSDYISELAQMNFLLKRREYDN